MPFNDEHNASIKNLQQFKEYGSRRILAEFKKNWKEKALNT